MICQGKNDAFLAEIFERLYKANGEVLGTRATPGQFRLVKSVLPEAEYDEISRIIKVQKKQDEKKLIGNIAVCTAGTADIPVAEEAQFRLSSSGFPTE